MISNILRVHEQRQVRRLGTATRHWRVGVVGFGHVGKAFADLLWATRPELASRHGMSVAIGLLATRNRVEVARDGAPPEGGLNPEGDLSERPAGTTDLQSYIGEAPIDVLVELTPWVPWGSEPGLGHLKAAFASGVHAITANKAPVALDGRELREEAARAGLGFRYEAAVMDCLPIMGLRRTAIPLGSVDEFSAVPNSTTNFVLDKMASGTPKDEAIAHVQRWGISEADPTLDLDGWDAAFKAAILAYELLGVTVRGDDVDRAGIGSITDADAQSAAAQGECYRVVARGSRSTGIVSVAPERMARESFFGSVRGLSMSVSIQSQHAGQLQVTLMNPSLAQAAYAVVMDLVALNTAVSKGDIRPPRGSAESVHSVGPGWM